MPLDLTCYVQPHWRPRIRAAHSRREWMDATRDSFAYRCLPLNIANAHGWEILSPCGFEAIWNGGAEADDVMVVADERSSPDELPVTLFGHGVLTFHVNGLLRTPPGWNLWVGGPPNRFKDGIAPLGGVIETDWSPYTFTMNWRFTRPGARVRFEENEPICCFFPLPRDLLDDVNPRIAPIDEAPELKRRFEEWSEARNRFNAQIATHPPATPAERWQKFYFRGIDVDGAAGPDDHRSKLRLPEFAGSAAFLPSPAANVAAAKTACPVAHTRPTLSPDELLSTLGRLRALSKRSDAIHRRHVISACEFLDRHYAANWPLLLTGELEDWPALGRWSLDHLAAVADARRIDAPAGVADAPATLAGFFARAGQADAAERPLRLTADPAALPALAADLRSIDRLLSGRDRGRLWLETAGSGIAARQQTVNQLLLQIVGRRRVWLAPPGETPKLQAAARRAPLDDLSAPDLVERLPELRGLRLHPVDLAPGEILFVPYGWWRQTVAVSFSASLDRCDFVWSNPG